MKPTNGETSLIAMQMQLQREIEDKERKRIKGKEKKEIIGARGEECEKWTRDVLNESFMEEIATTWEVCGFIQSFLSNIFVWIFAQND